MNDENLRKAWKTFGWDKQKPEEFKAIGTPEFEEMLKESKIEKMIKNLDVTEKDANYIKDSLVEIQMHPEEILEVKESGQFTSDGDIIYKVVLTLDGDMERFVCYI